MAIISGFSGMEHRLLSDQWDHYRDLLELLGTQLDNRLKAWEEKVDLEALQLNEDMRDEFYHFIQDERHFENQYKVVLMNALFCASFALFEHHLTSQCGRVQRNRNMPFSVTEIKGSFTDRFKKYLKKLDISLTTDTGEWGDIKRYQAMRNKIMHEGGAVDANWPHFVHAKKVGILDWNANQLALTQPFCEKAIGDFKKFTLKVSRSVLDDAKRGAT